PITLILKSLIAPGRSGCGKSSIRPRKTSISCFQNRHFVFWHELGCGGWVVGQLVKGGRHLSALLRCTNDYQRWTTEPRFVWRNTAKHRRKIMKAVARGKEVEVTALTLKSGQHHHSP
ncbi:unnamed protein product, partial [Ectocarpus sp. 12 AP-2014]